MSLWVLIPLSFVHITVGGAIGFGLVFAACAERGVTMSQFSAYFHPSRSPNNIHRDRLIPFMEITNYHR
ncbi:hypothetical protein D8T65_23680 [Vibrio vulnificus]|nr:hypothetical protein D8T65_23680 [Vibrio vulnificus]